MGYKYSVQELDPERTARAALVSSPISRKQAIEICSAIRGKPLQKAIDKLQAVIDKKDPIRFTRFNRDMGHKPGKGIAGGRYPVKASTAILQLLNSVNSNAQEKGLATADLIISHVSTKGGSRPYHPGRHVRRKMKRTHVEVVVEQRTQDERKESRGRERRRVPAAAQASKKQDTTAKTVEKKAAPAPKKEAAKPKQVAKPAKESSPKKDAAPKKTQAEPKKQEKKE